MRSLINSVKKRKQTENKVVHEIAKDEQENTLCFMEIQERGIHRFPKVKRVKTTDAQEGEHGKGAKR